MFEQKTEGTLIRKGLLWKRWNTVSLFQQKRKSLRLCMSALKSLLPSAGHYSQIIISNSWQQQRQQKEKNQTDFKLKLIESRSPLIEGQVSVSKLCEQSSLQDFFGCLVLNKVDDDVLEPVVILRWGVFLGKSQKASVLQLDGLNRGS